MKRIRRIPRGNRCDKTPDSRGVLLFRSKKGKIFISRQLHSPSFYENRSFVDGGNPRWIRSVSVTLPLTNFLYDCSPLYFKSRQPIKYIHQLPAHTHRSMFPVSERQNRKTKVAALSGQNMTADAKIDHIVFFICL